MLDSNFPHKLKFFRYHNFYGQFRGKILKQRVDGCEGACTYVLYCLQTGQKSASDYVVLRERLSEQRRDVERALTRFVAKTGKSLSLLPQDKNAFPRKYLCCVLTLW